MIDFHSHILPEVDDGASSLHESLVMLRQSFLNGVDLMVATPHFYPSEEYPWHFLQRRNKAFQRLQDAMLLQSDVYPTIILGAEILYFPGISDAQDVADMMIGNSRSILIEPPMAPWTNGLFDDISLLQKNFDCTAVIAHVDRYMNYLHDSTLIERVLERDLKVQVNAEYFLNPKTVKAAVKHLKKGHIQLIGSDCHNVSSRPPNLGAVKKLARDFGAELAFRQLHQNAADLLTGKEHLE